MGKRILAIGAVLFGLILTVSISYAALGTLTEDELASETEITEGMGHADFAKTLVKEVAAEGLIPPAATTNDVFKFWENIGVIPPGGWDRDASITRADLVAILDLKEDVAADMTFDDLLKTLKKKLIDMLKTKKGFGGSAQSVSPIAPQF